MNVENILKVADAIEGRGPGMGFNMEDWARSGSRDADQARECGSTCCIAGWATIVKGCGLRSGDIRGHAEAYLDLTIKEGCNLFTPTVFECLYGEIPSNVAVAVLRLLAKTGVVDWRAAAESVGWEEPCR